MTIEVSLVELTVATNGGDPEPTGRYGWRIYEDGEEVASSFTSYDSGKDAIAVIDWLRKRASRLPLFIDVDV